jgi:hypothetical protein
MLISSIGLRSFKEHFWYPPFLGGYQMQVLCKDIPCKNSHIEGEMLSLKVFLP